MQGTVATVTRWCNRFLLLVRCPFAVPINAFSVCNMFYVKKTTTKNRHGTGSTRKEKREELLGKLANEEKNDNIKL